MNQEIYQRTIDNSIMPFLLKLNCHAYIPINTQRLPPNTSQPLQQTITTNTANQRQRLENSG